MALADKRFDIEAPSAPRVAVPPAEHVRVVGEGHQPVVCPPHVLLDRLQAHADEGLADEAPYPFAVRAGIAIGGGFLAWGLVGAMALAIF